MSLSVRLIVSKMLLLGVSVLTSNNKIIAPPGTSSSERDFRNNSKSFWNCLRYILYTDGGLVVTMWQFPLLSASLLNPKNGSCT